MFQRTQKISPSGRDDTLFPRHDASFYHFLSSTSMGVKAPGPGAQKKRDAAEAGGISIQEWGFRDWSRRFGYRLTSLLGHTYTPRFQNCRSMSLSDASSLEVDWTLQPLLQGSGRTAAPTSLRKELLNIVSSLHNTLSSGSHH
jgi:hypothetical protein